LRTLEHFLIDQVLPRVLTHRGRIVLHAGCVATPEGAIAFLGESGAGKSTLCAELARAGYPLLGDDGIVVLPAARGFEAIATYPGLRLLPDPLTVLFEDAPGGEAVAHTSAKRRLPCAGLGLTLAEAPAPLLALYWLTRGSQIEIGAMPDRDAFLALLRSSFLLHLDDRERSRRLFDRIGALSQALPVRRLTYPRELGRLPAVREALIADATCYRAPACASAS
jgi:serine kinase of HPr protein (carbohydrate metabolism regulator)